jgi:hypothetical protein
MSSHKKKRQSHAACCCYTGPLSRPVYGTRARSAYILNPYPAMHCLYLETRSAHSFWASLEVEKSMHSSRFAFSSVHTQQGCIGQPSFSQRAQGAYLWLRRRSGGGRVFEVSAHVGGGGRSCFL